MRRITETFLLLFCLQMLLFAQGTRNAVLTETHTFCREAVGMWTINGVTFVALKDSNIVMLELGENGTIEERGTISTESEIQSLCRAEPGYSSPPKLLAMSDSSRLVKIVDISNPSAVVIKRVLAQPMPVRSMWYFEGLLLMAAPPAVRIADIGDLSKPSKILDSFRVPGRVSTVFHHRNLFYVATDSAMLYAIDPMAPKEQKGFGMPSLGSLVGGSSDPAQYYRTVEGRPTRSSIIGATASEDELEFVMSDGSFATWDAMDLAEAKAYRPYDTSVVVLRVASGSRYHAFSLAKGGVDVIAGESETARIIGHVELGDHPVGIEVRDTYFFLLSKDGQLESYLVMDSEIAISGIALQPSEKGYPGVVTTSSLNPENAIYPGARLRIRIALWNKSPYMLYSAYATLKCADPKIVITRDEVHMDNVPSSHAGWGTQWAPDDFEIELPGDLADFRLLRFEVTVRDPHNRPAGPWVLPFVLPVNSLSLANAFVDDDGHLASIGNGDGRVGAGETIELVPELRSHATFRIEQVFARARTESKSLTLIRKRRTDVVLEYFPLSGQPTIRPLERVIMPSEDLIVAVDQKAKMPVDDTVHMYVDHVVWAGRAFRLTQRIDIRLSDLRPAAEMR